MDKTKTYLIRVKSNNQEYVYTAKVMEETEKFITFKDKFGKIFTYNIDCIVSFEEILQ